jgi:hypothetical protein
MSTTFPDFVAKFPPVSMPVTLGEDTHHAFSTENDPLTEAMIEAFISPIDGAALEDEFTEYVPCFAINDTEHFIALVWWKAELLNYSYTLATFKLNGELIDHQVIAQTKVGKGRVHRAVATITEDHEIMVAEGSSLDGNQVFDPTTSKMRNFEILNNGQIVRD